MTISYISIKILISLLRQNGIHKLVLSSGMRNIPFVSEVEADPDFYCYSVVDERNAAFFALGLSQQSGNEPVVIACTSGTAASNYLTGVTEAFYSHVPIVVITFDRTPYVLNQLETQKIDQPAIFVSVTKKSVSLPVIKDEEDIWYCQRLVNEAFIAMKQHEYGPVHINVPLGGDTNQLNMLFSSTAVQDTNCIKYYSNTNYASWEHPFKKLCASKRILIVMGQHLPMDDETKTVVRDFTSKFKVPILGDNLCNFRCNEMIMAEGLIKGLGSDTIEPLLPEIVITFGANFQERIKDLLKVHQRKFEHWGIDGDGVVRDVFRSETAVFEATAKEFFNYFINNYIDMVYSDEYLKLWKTYEDAVVLPELPWTNLYVAKEFSSIIPKDSILHLAILNSTRVHQFFKLDESINVYSNVNTFGIDGCLPTFMGQAAATDKLSFIVIGDLSFFYGMNALAIKHTGKNIRIMVINNGGAAEFHIPPDSHNRPTVDLHIGCAHHISAKGWAESVGYKYIFANSAESLKESLNLFVSREHEKPVLMEVFTDMRTDGPHMLSVYRHLEECIRSVVQ